MEILMTSKHINKVFDNVRFQNTMFDLAYRWSEEHAYEDIADYAKPIEVKLHQILDIDFSGELKMTKRPFGFKIRTNYSFALKDGSIRILPAEISFTCTASGKLSWTAKAIAK